MPGIAEHLERSTIRAIVDLEWRAGRLDAQARAGGRHEHHISVELDGRTVAKLGFLQRTRRGAGVQGQNAGERRRTRAVPFDAERHRRPDRDRGRVLIEADAHGRLGWRLR